MVIFGPKKKSTYLFFQCVVCVWLGTQVCFFVLFYFFVRSLNFPFTLKKPQPIGHLLCAPYYML